MLKILFFILLFISTTSRTKECVSDSGKLYKSYNVEVFHPTSIKEIQSIIKKARAEDKKISIAGARYSQGGQSHNTNSFHIDLKKFNQLIELNKKEKRVCIQAGMTWEQLQNILQPHNLSIQVMQSSNVFSIGGSASVNVHGRDLQYGPIIQSIHACTIINSKGQIQNLSRQENQELFSLVIGGYGLFGIIIEIELNLTDNLLCYKKQTIVPYTRYTQHFKNEILKDLTINLYYARLTTTPGKHFLKQIISVSYKTAPDQDKKFPEKLNPETHIKTNQRLFNFYRKYYGSVAAWIKTTCEFYIPAPWEKGTYVCRNQLMRPYVHCLENTTNNSTDLLQEYFIPPTHVSKFIDSLRYWSNVYAIKLLNVTIRWVPKNAESYLCYSHQDSFAFVLYFTTDLDKKSLEKVKNYTQNLITACQQCQGTFYLPYQQFASLDQVHACYPMMQEFIKKKNQYDPENIFFNNWYQNYILQQST